jgi:putative glycosyltransferase (TIGR04372 family)
MRSVAPDRVTYFIIHDLPFEPMLENAFLPLDRQAAHTGRPVAWEVMLSPPILILHLGCPDCGHRFSLDYYGGQVEDNWADCPGCGLRGRLSGQEAREVFEAKLRHELAAAGEADEGALARLGRVIACAAILLEPLCLVFVVKLNANLFGRQVQLTYALWLRAKRFSTTHQPLLIAAPPLPEECANSFLLTLWGRGHYLITRAAGYAEELLQNLGRHTEDNPAVALPTAFWDFRSVFEVSLTRFHPKVEQARHFIDLKDQIYWFVCPHVQVPEDLLRFHFTSDEEEEGRRWLARHGLGTEYIGFVGRDAAFPKATDWFSQSSRDMDIKTCLPAMRWLAAQGWGVARLGSLVAEPNKLPAGLPGVADYPAGDDRSPFLDLYLAAHATFIVSADSGLNMPHQCSGKPLMIINGVSCAKFAAGYVSSGNLHLAVKNVWDEQAGRPLTLRERFLRNLHVGLSPEDYARQGLRLVDNTEDEILAATREMYSRYVARDWVVTPDEERLQAAFDRLIDSLYPGYPKRFRLCYTFFRSNPHLLEDA